MALLVNNYSLTNGLVSDFGYVKLITISGTKNELTIEVKIYISKEAADTSLAPINQLFYKFKPDSSDTALNYHKQGYEYLKTLPEYEKALDVLEG